MPNTETIQWDICSGASDVETTADDLWDMDWDISSPAPACAESGEPHEQSAASTQEESAAESWDIYSASGTEDAVIDDLWDMDWGHATPITVG